MRTKPIPGTGFARAFTLIELLVVMTIIAVLAFAIFGGVNKALLKARKLTCQSVMKNAGDGLINYAADNYGKNPAPPSKVAVDTIYGDTGGLYSSEWLLAVLTGMDGSFQVDGAPADVKPANPAGTVYVEFQRVSQPKSGLYIDETTGKPRLCDPWGRDIIFAINSPSQKFAVPRGGQDDQVLDTYGFCEYVDTKVDPTRDTRAFAIMSFGEDGLKGKEASTVTDKTATFAGSDDVISW